MGARSITRHRPSEKQLAREQVAAISADELQEFRLRRTAYDAARANFTMVEEAYLVWTAAVLKKHGLSGRFSIDASTGNIYEGEQPQ